MLYMTCQKRGYVPQECPRSHIVSSKPLRVIDSSDIIFAIPRSPLTWKFFSFHPFLAKNLTTTSLSTESATSSTQAVISSSADNLSFQLESAKSVAICAGISSAASASASSGVCLYLNESRVPGATGPEGFADFAGAAAAAGGFLTYCNNQPGI